MKAREVDSQEVEVTTEAKTAWFEEIIRETEHYFQGEVQQDQRASWFLATNGILVAVAGGLEVTFHAKGYIFVQIILVLSLVSFMISSGISILTIMPFYGTRIWSDFIGKFYRRNKNINIEQLVEERFRHGNDWSKENYERRLMHHYRSHYLRFNRKAYGVLWSAIWLMIGLLLFLIVAISILI